SHQGDFTSFDSAVKVFTDSRKSTNPGLFVPLVGERFDAHDFLVDAIDQGAIATLWQIDHPLPDEVPEGFPFFFVEDTLNGLQLMARHALRLMAPHVIAV